MGLGLHKYTEGPREVWDWWLKGRPDPAPRLVKRRVLARLGRQHHCSVLVETGTYLGHMVEYARHRFDRVISIEIAPDLHRQAQERFKGDARVDLLLGDSGKVMPQILSRPDLQGKGILFWLDGHYSAGNTGRGEKDSPIAEELEAVFARDGRHDVILIDDARHFTGQGGYPDLASLLREIGARRPDLDIEVRMDIIRLTPKAH
jgi:hypothetical protein